MGEMTVGQEFAMRWFVQNHPSDMGSRNQQVDHIKLGQDIARAVDAYADKKRAELESSLRRIVANAIDDDTARSDVPVSVRELLESECMKFIATPLVGGMMRPSRFPVKL